MATSLSKTTIESIQLLRSFLRVSQSQFTGIPLVQNVNYSSSTKGNLDPKHHTNRNNGEPNRRRTHAQIAKVLRPKQNFLHFDKVDEHRNSPLQKGTESVKPETELSAPRNYRYIMPEFMPRPDWETRDRLLEKLERQDMLKRRSVINIPEFYVGSIMSVTVTDSYAPNKKNRFMGICIDRGGYGLKAWFILRNHVDGLGVEVMYDMYSPTIHSIQVVKLEKRLDDQLYYLRDAPPEYSTFPFDMEAVALPKGSEVPVNTTKVKLKPSTEWHWRWESYQPLGIEPFELKRHEKRAKRAAKEKAQYTSYKHDLMREYRSKVNEDEEEQIMSEVYKEKQSIDTKLKIGRATLKRK